MIIIIIIKYTIIRRIMNVTIRSTYYIYIQLQKQVTE